MSDSSFAAATRYKKPFSSAGRPIDIDRIDDEWAADTLSDDDIDLHRHELAIAPLLDDGDLDIDAVVVSNGQMGSAMVSAVDRRRKEECKWADLGLDQFDVNKDTNPSSDGRTVAVHAAPSASQRADRNQQWTSTTGGRR